MNKEKYLLTAKQVSKYLGVPIRTIQRLSKEGRIKSFKIGSQWRYSKKDIEKYGFKYTTKKGGNFLNAKQVSACLCVSIRTVRRLTKQGKIKAFKIGDRWRYLREDIKRYISTNTDFSIEPARKQNTFIERSDRRSYPRINSNFKCLYSIKLQPFKNINGKGIIKDISAGGIFLIEIEHEMSKINVKDPIDLNFNLINKGNLINIRTEGRVIRKDNVGAGIKFRNMNEKTKDKIIEYVG